MKTIKSLKDITTLEVGDKVVFGKLKYTIVLGRYGYYLSSSNLCNTRIFDTLNVNKHKFIESLGIHANYEGAFPETKSLEALTALVSALFKEYEKQNALPKTWEEFCKKNPLRDEERYITSRSGIEKLYDQDERSEIYDKNVCASRKDAEAFIALMQLRQLRKAYVGDWKPNGEQQYYGVVPNIHGLDIIPYGLTYRSMSFPTKELAKEFLTNFKDLLEIAKSLL